jgi:Tol biopolymer transport system component
MSLEGESQPQFFLQTESNESSPKISPDGRWLAYQSNESGRIEVYVRPFPKAEEGKWQISMEGGMWPVWAGNGRELFYRSGNKMMVVNIESQSNLAVGKPRLLFERPPSPLPMSSFDVTPDGQRFLMIQAGEQQAEVDQINVVLNWFEELKERVPVP